MPEDGPYFKNRENLRRSGRLLAGNAGIRAGNGLAEHTALFGGRGARSVFSCDTVKFAARHRRAGQFARALNGRESPQSSFQRFLQSHGWHIGMLD